MRKLDKPYSGSGFSLNREVFFPRTSRSVFGSSYRHEEASSEKKWYFFFSVFLTVVALVLI